MFQKHSYPLGDHRQPQGRALRGRGRGLPQLHLRQVRRARSSGSRSEAAFQIFDQKTVPLLREEYRIREITKAEAGTIEELAEKLEIDPAGLAAPSREFNAAVTDRRRSIPRSRRQAGPGASPAQVQLGAAARHAALRGLRGDLRHHLHLRRPARSTRAARVLDREDRPIPGLYAAGELVGGLFYHNYPGGSRPDGGRRLRQDRGRFRRRRPSIGVRSYIPTSARERHAMARRKCRNVRPDPVALRVVLEVAEDLEEGLDDARIPVARVGLADQRGDRLRARERCLVRAVGV